MKNLNKAISSISVMMFCLLTMRVIHAGGKPPSLAQCDDNLGISIAVMDFGTYVGGTSGTIIMDVNGAMVHSGLVPVGGTTGTPAIITLSPVGKNCEKHLVTFAMPSSISITNLSGSPATTITITNLTNNLLNNPFEIRNLTNGQIRMWGTLTATSGGAQADYSGNYNVTVTY